MSAQLTTEKFTVIGADWCGFTKKLLQELDEHNLDYDYIECSDQASPECKLVSGYPHVTACGKEHAQTHLENKAGVSGYRQVQHHPVINGEISCSSGGAKAQPKTKTQPTKAKAQPKKKTQPKKAKALVPSGSGSGSGGGHPFTVIGASWCGFTNKMKEELDIDNVDHNYHFIDCGGEDKDHELCKHVNIKGFPTCVCGHGDDAKKELDAGNHVPGYAALDSHKVVNGTACSSL